MKLTVAERSSAKKKEVKQMRREGKIPAILYCAGHPNQQLVLDGAEFNAIIRNMKSGHLSTTVFHLNINGKEKRAIIKDIQYRLTTYQVSHIDFEELIEDVPVTVKVSIQCIEVANCVGVKLGGFLRQVMRCVKVECLPKFIPEEFVVDVQNLGIRQSKRLADLSIPKGVKLLAKMDEVVVVIAKRTA